MEKADMTAGILYIYKRFLPAVHKQELTNLNGCSFLSW